MELQTLNLIIDILFFTILLSLFVTSYITILKKIRLTNDLKMKISFIFIVIVNTFALMALAYIQFVIKQKL